MQSESDQYMLNNGGKAASSQQRTVEDQYSLNPDDRQYYIDMFKSLVSTRAGLHFCRIRIVTATSLAKRQLVIFLKLDCQEKSLSSCFRCVTVVRIIFWM